MRTYKDYKGTSTSWRTYKKITRESVLLGEPTKRLQGNQYFLENLQKEYSKYKGTCMAVIGEKHSDKENIAFITLLYPTSDTIIV